MTEGVRHPRLLRILVAVAAAAFAGCAGTAAPGPPSPESCPVVEGDADAAAPSHVEFPLTDGDGCVVPIRHGDERFGAEHIRRRHGEGGGHPIDPAARRRMEEALAGAGHQIDDTFYVFAAPAGGDETQCLFVDFRRYDGYARKGVVTSYLKAGRHDARGCD